MILRETARIVRRGPGVLICETRHGFVCANAGVDLSNAPGEGVAVLLPEDPDASARRLRAALAAPGSEPPAVIVSAVRLVLAGGTYVPPRLLSSSAGAGDGTPDLTPRQVEVLRLLAQGLPNKSIANALGVSEGTVKVHLIAVFRALNVRNRTAAVLAAKGHLG